MIYDAVAVVGNTSRMPSYMPGLRFGSISVANSSSETGFAIPSVAEFKNQKLRRSFAISLLQTNIYIPSQ
jgi:hypothetical protein